MKLLILGSSGYHPTERRHTACLMLPEAGIVLDAGTGFFRVRELLATDSLDIFLSHAHLDHSVGLTFLLSTLFQQPVGRVAVHGEADKLKAIREHLLNERLFPAPLPCQWQPLPDGPVHAGAATLSWFRLEHPGGSVGYRLDWHDRSLAYVTDTRAAPSADYVSKIRGVDLLVHECNFRDGQEDWAQKTGHSCTSAVAQVAREAGVGQLLLTHLDALATGDDPVDIGAARSIFHATEIAYDGMALDF
jgi:ribonuclease Z